MVRRMKALIWSRGEVLLANKQAGLMLLFPMIFAIVYGFMFKNQEDSNYLVFSIILPMISGMIGYIIPTLIGEEVEKNNQRNLLLAGVKFEEYLLANITIPFMTIIVYFIVLPIGLGVEIKNWISYLTVNIVTSLVVILLFMIIALLFDTQSKASIGATPVLFASLLLPMLYITDEKMAKIIDFTFMGAFAKWNLEGSEYQLTDKTFSVLLAWLVLSTVLTLLAIKNRKQLH